MQVLEDQHLIRNMSYQIYVMGCNLANASFAAGEKNQQFKNAHFLLVH